MLYVAPKISKQIADLLAEFDDLKGRLRHGLGRRRPWSHPLRRQAKADAWASSVRIEGFAIENSQALDILSKSSGEGEDAGELAFRCYAEAMEHVATLVADPHFEWSRRVIQDLHFEACRFQPGRNPGLIRTSSIEVTGEAGETAYVAPDADRLVTLLDEFAGSLAARAPKTHIAVEAAMAHLNLVSIHPFEDGNGRISRIVQSLVLARDGLLAPEFGSIEPYLASNTHTYYLALREVQRGHFDPSGDTSAWVEFCLQGHVDQANRRLRLLEQAAERWTRLEEIAVANGWPDRLVIALEQCWHGSVDRSTYGEEAGVSLATASQDLRRLVDAGYLSQVGRGRSTAYRPTDRLNKALYS